MIRRLDYCSIVHFLTDLGALLKQFRTFLLREHPVVVQDDTKASPLLFAPRQIFEGLLIEEK